MSRSPIPKMTHHKASRQAVVRLAGKDHYLGPWGSTIARAEYDRLVAEWLANGRRPDADGGTRVAEVLAAFWDHAQAYYRHPDGTPTNELRNYRDALRAVRRLYGHTPAEQFGPLALKAVRQEMMDDKLCRTTINRHVGRLKHVFKWAVENELVAPSLYHGLQAVSGLKMGRSEARESDPVRPVPDEMVDAVIGVLSPTLGQIIRLQEAAGQSEPLQAQVGRLADRLPHESPVAVMIQLQRLTGMRPGEAAAMRSCDIETTGRLWVYRPSAHKTAHHGHRREVYLGPRAQQVLRPFLRPDLQAYLFSPVQAMANHRRQLSESRRMPLSCGNVPGSNQKRKPLKTPTDRYTTNAYARCIARACEVAFGMPGEIKTVHADWPLEGDTPEQLAAKAARRKRKAAQRSAWHKEHCWHPHQLRHSAATKLRKEFGLEAAQVILGHRTLSVTELYAEKNVAAALQIMSKVG